MGCPLANLQSFETYLVDQLRGQDREVTGEQLVSQNDGFTGREIWEHFLAKNYVQTYVSQNDQHDVAISLGCIRILQTALYMNMISI